MKRHVLTALLLCVALCLPALAMAEEDTRQKIDIVFLMDTTWTMPPKIATINGQMADFAAELPDDKFDVRYGLAGFGDETSEKIYSDLDYPEVTKRVELGGSYWTSDVSLLKEYLEIRPGNLLKYLPKYYGVDTPETSTNAVYDVATWYDWREDALRFIILVTDAPPKDAGDYDVSDGRHVVVKSMNTVIEECKKLNISVSVAGFKDAGEDGQHNKLAEETGGLFQMIDDTYTTRLLGVWLRNAPFISVEPSDFVDKDQKVVLEVSGDPKNSGYTNIKWQKMPAGESDWQDFGDSEQYSVSIGSAGIADDGTQFRWLGSYNSTPRGSNVITLSVFGVKEEPSSQKSVDAGADVDFTVEATGDAAGYRWEKQEGSTWIPITDGESVSGATSTKLQLSGVKVANSGEYRCVATSKRGTTCESRTATLSVFDITTQPESTKSAEVGATVTLLVAASGDVKSYQWEKEVNGSWTEISGATGATLQLSNVMGSDAGSYRCVITSERNTTATSNAAVLTVLPALAFTTNPTDALVESGKTASFAVQTAGDGVTYQWQRKKPGGDWTDMTGKADATLELGAVSEGDDGSLFRCVATSSLGTVKTSTEAKLTVVSAPAITLQPQDVFTEDGKDAVFSVAATGEGMTYQWQEEVNGAWTPVSSATGTKLTVTASPEKNGRRYRCVVKNRLGTEVTSTPATLTVTGAPAITLQPQSLRVAVGQDASFTIEATGYDLRYQWQVRTENGFADCPDGQTPTLTLKARRLTDDGSVYRCVVRSGFGTELTSEEVTLSVLALPDLPETGDSSRLGLWAALCAACVLGLAALKRRA